jgi:hypothetical protein
MELSRKKTLTPPSGVTDPADRRRVARIIHDDRGNASVKWQDAPPGYKRQVLELERDDSHVELSIEATPRSFDPYSCHKPPEPKKAPPPRTDLRKLSEWIKMMREREELKAKGEDEG